MTPKNSGGVTMSHLRFGKTPINKPYLVTEPEFIACHRQSYVHEYDLLRGIKKWRYIPLELYLDS